MLSPACSQIAKEDAVLPVALFPSLCELIFHNNPLVAHRKGMVPGKLPTPTPVPRKQCGDPHPHLLHPSPGLRFPLGWTRGMEETTDTAEYLLHTHPSRQQPCEASILSLCTWRTLNQGFHGPPKVTQQERGIAENGMQNYLDPAWAI